VDHRRVHPWEEQSWSGQRSQDTAVEIQPFLSMLSHVSLDHLHWQMLSGNNNETWDKRKSINIILSHVTPHPLNNTHYKLTVQYSTWQCMKKEIIFEIGFLCCPGWTCGPNLGRSRRSRVIDWKRKGYRRTDRLTNWHLQAKQYALSS